MCTYQPALAKGFSLRGPLVFLLPQFEDHDHRAITIDFSCPVFERIEQAILLIRHQKVMLDEDLARLYQVPTGLLVRQVKRNLARFPADFMFQLTPEEWTTLRSHFGISKAGRGGRRYAPYAFTEQGVAMLASVLRSPRAIQVNVEIVRAFVRLRRLLATHEDLARKLEALEKKYDKQFQVVFDAIRALITPPEPKRRPIGFVAPGTRKRKK